MFYKKGIVYRSRAPEFTPGFWWGPCCSLFLVFLCCLIRRFFFLGSFLWSPLQFRVKKRYSFFLPPVCRGASRLIYVIWVCLCIVVANIYVFVFLFCLSSSCVPFVAGFFGLSIVHWPSVLSNFYYLHNNHVVNFLYCFQSNGK